MIDIEQTRAALGRAAELSAEHGAAMDQKLLRALSAALGQAQEGAGLFFLRDGRLTAVNLRKVRDNAIALPGSEEWRPVLILPLDAPDKETT